MKVAFFLDNKHLQDIDFSDPERGNPGTGAGTYLHAAIPYFLNKNHINSVETIILAPNIHKMPENVKAYEANCVIDAASKAKELGVDFFVFRPRIKEEDGILDHIDKIQLPSIGRAALTPHASHLKKMANSKYFRSLVCVGREQYDYLMDSKLGPRLAYIDNGVNLDSCEIKTPIQKNNKMVVYMGALVPMKGFHQLAEAWPKVLERVPDAKLSVIGSVKIYGEAEKVGPLGVAHESYEKESIIPYLCDENGTLHPSVTFHGQLGEEKYKIMQGAMVGVANPTGDTETCCVSAVEMAGCKTAVVSGAYYALLDTVIHKKTGLLGRGVDDLADNICRCLENPDVAIKYGEAGYKRVKQQYDFSVVIPKWVSFFNALEQGKSIEIYGKLKNIRYHYKGLRILNFILQKTIGKIVYWPSVFEMQNLVYTKFMYIKSVKQKLFK